jgi:hypothetical protein
LVAEMKGDADRCTQQQATRDELQVPNEDAMDRLS